MRPFLAHLPLIPVLMAGIVMHSQETTPFSALRDHKRVLLVFAGDADTRVEQQWNTVLQHRTEAAERDLVTVRLGGSPIKTQGSERPPEAIVSQAEERELRARFHIPRNSFTVVLVGKDGGEKLRSDQPVSWDKLQGTIDSMPMRQAEMRRSR